MARGRKLVGSDSALQKALVEQAENVNTGQALQTDMATTDKAVAKKSRMLITAVSSAAFLVQLELQKDPFPDARVPTADQVVGNKPDLQDKSPLPMFTTLAKAVN